MIQPRLSLTLPWALAEAVDKQGPALGAGRAAAQPVHKPETVEAVHKQEAVLVAAQGMAEAARLPAQMAETMLLDLPAQERTLAKMSPSTAYSMAHPTRTRRCAIA